MAGAAAIAALALTPAEAPRRSCPTVAGEHADDGARLASSWQRHAAGDHLVVTIAAPAAPAARLPSSVAIAIDRSRSMTGAPIEDAKAAAARLVSQLAAVDAFSVIAYSATWNESDKKTLGFYNRMAASQNEIEAIGGDEIELQIAKSPAYSDFMRQFQQNTTALKDMNFLGTNIGKVGSALSNMKSFQELKKNDPAAAAYVEAQIPFVMGRLRKDPGAAIAPTEFWETINEFFPITNANEREIRNEISRRRDQLAGELDTLDVDIVE